MPFHTFSGGYIEGRGRPAAKLATGCDCGCATKGPAPDTGGDLVRAMQALVINSKIDKALDRMAPLHTHGIAQPLVPRGLLGQRSATESATDDATGPLRAQGLMDAPRRQDAPSQRHSAPLRPRGLMAGGR